MKGKQKKNTKPTLSDRIADALTLKPRADIEDDHVFGTKPQTVSRADLESSESESEAAISDFRKRNVNLLSEVSKKYEGEVTTRKSLQKSESELSDDNSEDNSKLLQESDSEFEEEPNIVKSITNGSSDDDSSHNNDIQTLGKQQTKSSSESDEGGESDDYSITRLQKQIHGNSDESDEEQDNDDDNEDEGQGYDISQLEEPMKEEFEHVKKQNISEEAKKGGCVRNQLLIWENLLEMRIHLQRCMGTANQMPMPESYGGMKQDNQFLEESNSTKLGITNILDKLLTLQSLLLKNFPETKSLSTKKSDKQIQDTTKADSDEEIPSDTDNEEIPSDTEPEDNEPKTSPKTKSTNLTKKRKLTDYETEISTTHKTFKAFRDTSIQKWNDKTRLATATNIKNAPTNTILQQISYILSDREKLLKRTQLKRSEYDIVGYQKPETEEIEEQNEVNPVTRSRKDDDEYIPEIFDDSDFYHQLLRELIECKSADISDPVQLSRQWISLQQMRSKMKRKVDTKATKGRKIKYVVHNPLVNFMAPEKCTSWADESTNELCSSMFGKIFENNNMGLSADVGQLFKLK